MNKKFDNRCSDAESTSDGQTRGAQPLDMGTHNINVLTAWILTIKGVPDCNVGPTVKSTLTLRAHWTGIFRGIGYPETVQ